MPLYEMAPGFAAREKDGVVFLSGELEAATADHARTALRAAQDRVQAPVVIDLSALTFCDSCGVRVLLDAVLGAMGRPRRPT